MNRAFIALAATLALMGPPVRAATYTVPYSLPSQSYIDLGIGPMEIQVTGNQSASFVASDTQPSASVAGQRLTSNSQAKPFCQTSHIWGIGAGFGTTVVVNPTTACTFSNSNPAVFYARNITLTTSPTQLPGLALGVGVICAPRSANTGSTFVGGADMTTSTNQLPLSNGQPFALGVTQLSAVYAYSTVAGDILDCYGN